MERVKLLDPAADRFVTVPACELDGGSVPVPVAGGSVVYADAGAVRGYLDRFQAGPVLYAGPLPDELRAVCHRWADALALVGGTPDPAGWEALLSRTPDAWQAAAQLSVAADLFLSLADGFDGGTPAGRVALVLTLRAVLAGVIGQGPEATLATLDVGRMGPEFAGDLRAIHARAVGESCRVPELAERYRRLMLRRSGLWSRVRGWLRRRVG